MWREFVILLAVSCWFVWRDSFKFVYIYIYINNYMYMHITCVHLYTNVYMRVSCIYVYVRWLVPFGSPALICMTYLIHVCDITYSYMYLCVCVCVWERESVSVCLCVYERKRERGIASEWARAWDRKTDSVVGVLACVCVHVTRIMISFASLLLICVS